jgi:hypothetical protein
MNALRNKQEKLARLKNLIDQKKLIIYCGGRGGSKSFLNEINKYVYSK